jgi:transcription elongation factor GreA
MKKLFRLTQSGVDELQNELQGLIAKRAGLADAIKAARELGDLSENAEYQSARADQDRAESRIAEIENILQNVQIIKAPKASEGKVQLGSTVKLKNDGKTKSFQVVGTVEADPSSGKISDESPIGQALLGQKLGDSVEIQTPAETVTYKIIEIA